MTNLLILMFLYLSYVVISFWLFNGNFLSPSFVFSISLTVMLCLAYYTANDMGMLFAINLKTFSIFGFAGFVFLATEFFVYASHTMEIFNHEEQQISEQISELRHEPLIVSQQVQWVFTAFLVVSVFASLVVLYANTGGGSWSQRMIAYKDKVLAAPDSIRYRFIVSQLYKINSATMNLFGYILVYNLAMCGSKLRELSSYVLDVLLYAVFSSVYNGARQPAIEMLLFLMLLYITLNMRPGGRQKIYRFICQMIPILLVVASLFTVWGTFVGRHETHGSGFEHLAKYVCGGLYAFNLHIDDGASTQLFGEASFAYIYAIPQNMGLLPRTGTMAYAAFELYGNTITIFGRWYRDFGTVGVFVMTSLVSMFYSKMFYGKIIYSNNLKREHHLARIFYCQLLMGLIWAGYDDRIASLMTVKTLTSVVLVILLYKFLVIKRYKFF